MQFQTDVTIRRPLADVFAFVTDLSNAPLWQQGVFTSIAVTPGPTRVGSTFEEDVKMGFFHVPTRYVVTALETDRRMAFEATSAPIGCQGEIRFEPVPGGTRLTIQATGELRGLWKVMEPLMRIQARRGLEQEAGRIRLHLEAQPAAG